MPVTYGDAESDAVHSGRLMLPGMTPFELSVQRRSHA